MRRLGAALLGVMLSGGCGVIFMPVPNEVLVADAPVEAYATSLMRTILAVTPHAHVANRYRIQLARLRAWRGFAGLSAGGGMIYVDAAEARRAFLAPQGPAATQLAMVLAHEIAHEVAGHAARARFAAQYALWLNEPAAQARRELEADRLAITYWKALGWSCQAWTARFTAVLADEQRGCGRSPHHPTGDRLAQAHALCALAR